MRSVPRRYHRATRGRVKHLLGLLAAAIAVGTAVTAATPGASSARARCIVLDRLEASSPAPIVSSVLDCVGPDPVTAPGGAVLAASY